MYLRLLALGAVICVSGALRVKLVTFLFGYKLVCLPTLARWNSFHDGCDQVLRRSLSEDLVRHRRGLPCGHRRLETPSGFPGAVRSVAT